MSEAGKKKSSPADKAVNAVICLIVIAFVAVGAYATWGKLSEGMKYKAIESGEKEATVEYLAEKSGMEVEDFLTQYGLALSDTINKDTTESEVIDNMTLENYVKYTGGEQSAEEMIEGTGLKDKVTKDTLWKDFMPQVPAISIIGDEETFNNLKEQYGFGDEVTMDMPWGEFEALVEAKQAETMAAAEQTPTATEGADVTEAPVAE